MKVYKLDVEGNYLGEQECQPCPVTGGFLYPAYYTETKPPVGEFKSLKFEDNNWIAENFKNIYNKENKQKVVIGEFEDIPNEFTDKVPEFTDCEIFNSSNNQWEISFELKKEAKIKEIVEAFSNSISNGSFSSTALGIDVDCRRDTIKNDLQNVQGLISYMERNSITKVDYKGYTEVKSNTTIAMLTNLCNEMEDHVLGLYEKKWTLETMVENCNTVEEVESIEW